MCGIFLSLSKEKHLFPSNLLRKRLNARGPDWTTDNSYETEFVLANGTKLYAVLVATVLSLRGPGVTPQPMLSRLGESKCVSHCLCWNGEAWLMNSKTIVGNDGEQIFRSFTSERGDVETLVCDPRKTLGRTDGPFAFIYLDAQSGEISFGRDVLGRRSLLMRDTNDELYISSVGDDHPGWTELDANTIHTLRLNVSKDRDTPLMLQSDLALQSMFCHRSQIPVRTTRIVDGDDPRTGYHLCRALRDDWSNIEDLTASWRLKICSKLKGSIELRINDVPGNGLQCDSFYPASVAVLFSGGLDCTLLARLMHDLVPKSTSIDLLNVAFQNPRKDERQAKAVGNGLYNPYEACPDRMTARASHFELTQVCAERIWRLVTIDVPYTETIAHRPTVMSLMAPHDTEMDLSISYALYFASRGTGDVTTGDSTPSPFASSARVLFSGLGADELFGGYQRHALAFQRQGFEGLLDELDLDFKRLGKRNLGRDDRVMSQWGKEVRFPYLDEDFIRTTLECPVWLKCGFGGASDALGSDLDPAKRLLRLVARDLGMDSVANEKKRAIQFGARTAKMETAFSYFDAFIPILVSGDDEELGKSQLHADTHEATKRLAEVDKAFSPLG